MIPDELYEARLGTTDLEAIFLAALANGLDEDPIGAMARTLSACARSWPRRTGEPLRFTAALSDGDDLYAFRWACDGRPPSLYLRKDGAGWPSCPSRSTDAATAGARSRRAARSSRARPAVAVECLNEAMARVAAWNTVIPGEQSEGRGSWAPTRVRVWIPFSPLGRRG